MNAQEISLKQLEVVKGRAVELWGDEKWLPRLVSAFEDVSGAEPRTKFKLVQGYFKNGVLPNLKTMNWLLKSVNCEFQIACFSQPLVKTIN